jgi:hypothetical protein
LSKGDVIAINYNKKIYELNVLETKPANAVSIIECDMNVEFEAPPGYVVSSSRIGRVLALSLSHWPSALCFNTRCMAPYCVIICQPI